MGVALALGFVLVLLGVSLKLLQRLAPGTTRGRGRVPMEIVQRMSLGPKQGIAVVRIGQRVIAVSLGEGGMRRLFELGDEESDAIIAALAPAPLPVATVRRPDFRSALTAALGSVGVRTALVFCLLLGSAAIVGAQVAAPRTTPTAPGTPTSARTTAAGTGAAGTNAPRPAMMAASAPRVNGRADAILAAAQAAAIMARQGTAATPAASATATKGAQTPKTAAAAPGTAQVAAPQAASVANVAVTRIAPSMDLRVGGESDRGGLRLSGTVGIVVMMGLLTLLPTLLLMMTSFTRILIVLHFLRQALGTQNAPPAQLVAAIALMLTGFVMAPTLTVLNRDALQPWMAGTIDQGQMLERGAVPFRAFMLRQTRDHDLQVFVDLSKGARPATADDVPLVTLMSAFVTSELRTSFQIGFALFLPFIIIDVVVSSVLMSMGMFMLPPAMISLPFKLLLFVLVDGWTLIVQSLVASFR
jgi:flagellar biosynthetic protein FliP